MYKVIGADQREYGPVEAEKLRRWIAEGRADAQTKVRAEEGGEWKALSDFPEFTDALAAKISTSQPAPPRIAVAGAEKLATEIIARDYRVDIGDCFSRSWNLIKDDFWLLVGATALVLVISIGIQFIPFLGHAAGVLFGFLLWGGLDLLFLKRLRGKPADVSDAFAGFSLAFVPLMLASIVAHVLVLCVVPGIYLFVAWWMFVPLLILDKGLEFWPAMECSRKVVTKHWWPCFGLFLLCWLVGLLGSIACGAGVFFTLPIAVGATVCAYEDIFSERRAPNGLLPSAPPPPTSEPPPTAPTDTNPAPEAPPEDGATPSAPPPAAQP